MSTTTVVFVHGLGGDLSTWGKFPDLIKGDAELKDCEVVSFEYPTSLFRWPWSKESLRIQTLSDALRTLLEERYPNRRNLILVCHSLGGLIARRYLVDTIKRRTRIRVTGLLLYAVPNDGADLARVGDCISWNHSQLRQLCKQSDLIRDLESDWATFDVSKRIRVRYVVGGEDRVVDERSARSSWGEPNFSTVADRGHISLVKPNSAGDLSYEIFKKFALSLTARIEPYATPLAARHWPQALRKGRYRVVAFDLDGTVLRGIEYSWTVVWKYLGFPEAVYKGAMMDYLKGVTTYTEWCELACRQFRARNLKRSDFPRIVSEITVINNFQETVEILKSLGFVLALISGGMDTFIEEKIPNAAKLFDYICINRLHYEQPSGLVSGVDPTPFDFEGKADALEAICKRHSCSMEESVFVGQGLNDQKVIRDAGYGIAYLPAESMVEAASKNVIGDDLSKILDYVL